MRKKLKALNEYLNHNKNLYEKTKLFCEIYELQKQRLNDKHIKKHLYKKRYIDMGLGYYYVAYIHSRITDKYGEWYVFVKNKKQIDMHISNIDNYVCVGYGDGLLYVHKSKTNKMVHKCNEKKQKTFKCKASLIAGLNTP